MALKTRPPTGRVPWPLILIEGGEKSGKSWACAQFSTSKRIGQMYWIDLGEGAADEYGAIPGANYLVVDHDGTWAQIYAAVEAIRDEAARAAEAGAPPVVLTIDSMTAEWDLLKGCASLVARQRHDEKARRNGRKPIGDDEEPKISMDLWNAANDRHRKLMKILMTFPGIVLMTARGKEVAALDDKGNPIPNAREYRVEGQKSLGFDASCWIRLDRSEPGYVVGVRSVHVGLRPGYDDPIPLDRNWTVEGIVFDTLRCDPATAHVRDLVELRPDDEAPTSPTAAAMLAAVEAAPDDGALRRVYAAIGGALDRGDITRPEADLIADAVKARKPHVPAGPDGGNGQVPMVTQDQHRRMAVLWRQLGLDGPAHRDKRLARTSQIIRRNIDTSAALTYEQAQGVIAVLTQDVKELDQVGVRS